MENPNTDDLAAALAAVIAMLAIVYFYFLYKRSNTQYFKPVARKKNKSYFCKALKSIFPVVKPDPVKHCPIYKKEGCAHVDGPLCDIDKCNPTSKSDNVIHIRKE